MNRRLRYYYKIRNANWLRGLTHNGHRRQRRPRGQKPTLEERRALARRKWRQLARKRVAAGLTTKNRPRRRNRLGRPTNPVAIAYQQFKAALPGLR